ncbi:FAD-binding oxidoreductase [Amycolatopsis rubida]|uniref:D-amino-acid dehydrogenase n=1 Tax=Amycolatopsis rubida TaxID=112413 RepID=A0A1I6AXJ5_9PSEU|nr:MULTISPECIES: FAD-dependent oxidoreductase [Amycolatopsis]MYW91766.1 FAD-dependent oxidoreductase [Amycolatopsis rubida]NEC56751.1 FAD-binding oxidoreductase [Amycolatopsis rubida]OAP21691.1 D-amino acid dehydrogenase small subunit [Amycolatopsis sp. M39]SFQ73404.1 D-amino-acid dehydrogenase [Amycolatopsis rubida]
MSDLDRLDGGPRSVIVVGAGIVGLSTAWFLQERGVRVTVVDREGIAAGSSWGNAGWLSPGLAIPLNEPAVLRYGLRTLLDRQAPLHVPATPDPRLWQFLARFAANCTHRSWNRAVRANLPFNEQCLEAFDILTANGVDAPTVDAPITALFETSAKAQTLVKELDRLGDAGQKVSWTQLAGPELREHFPQVTDRIGTGIRLDGQRYADPGRFVESLARAVVSRGGTIRHRFEVAAIRRHEYAYTVLSANGQTVNANAVVLATGAWLGELAHKWGVRVPVRAGRGYSFTVPADEPVPSPMYLPDIRVACTPYRGGLRVAGTMEFRKPDDPLYPARVDAIIASARPLLKGLRWDQRTDVWVGSRPVSADGRPVIGQTGAPGMYVAGGHGMWGLSHGAITGKLLAEQMVTGRQPEALRPFDPLR